MSALAVIVAYAFARSVSDVATGRTVALVVLVLTGLYLVLLLEDEAMQESKVRARSVLDADGAAAGRASSPRS